MNPLFKSFLREDSPRPSKRVRLSENEARLAYFSRIFRVFLAYFSRTATRAKVQARSYAGKRRKSLGKLLIQFLIQSTAPAFKPPKRASNQNATFAPFGRL
jgi:hypothetical protein